MICPPALRDQFIGETGKFLLQVYPKADVWERTNQEAFVTDLRTVDPNVTGTPVQLLVYETLLKDSYVKPRGIHSSRLPSWCCSISAAWAR